MPDSIRVKLVPLIDDFRGGKGLPGAYTIGPALYEALGRIPPQPTGDMHMIRELFRKAEWWEIYDLADSLLKMCGRREEMASRIETIFSEANVPYAMTADGIVWRFSEPAIEAITETERLLVEEPALKGPAQQWKKAVAHLSARPPDTENCIKDAIGAVEGLRESFRATRKKRYPRSSSRLRKKSMSIRRARLSSTSFTLIAATNRLSPTEPRKP